MVISNMWEIGALVKALDRKGILTKEDVQDTMQELRRREPRA